MAGFFQYLRPVLLFTGLAMLLPAAYSLYLGEALWPAYLSSAVLLLAPGIQEAIFSLRRFLVHLWQVFVLKERRFAWNLLPSQPDRPSITLSQSDAIVVAALSWILIPLVTSVPYVVAGYSLENALFESMSGWTTTGLSFAQGLDRMPLSVLFFRSFTQWIGGVGIILFALLALRSPAASQLLRAESRDTVALGVKDTVKAIWGIYLLLTAACVALLLLTGANVQDAVNYAMALLSTGGFAPSDSFAIGAAQKAVFILFMIAGATGFSLHFSLLRGQLAKLRENTELKFMLAALFLGAALVFLFIGGSVLDAAFNVASAVSTTGFATQSFDQLGDFPVYLLVLLMIAGSCAGSTGGGLKLWRVATLLKTLVSRVRQAFLPQGAVQVVRINQKILKNEDVVESGTFIFLYLFVFMLSAGILMALGRPILESTFLAASALGNVGLSIGVDWFSFPLIGKAVLFVTMWLGRIEILPSLVLLRALRHPGD